MTRLMEVAVFGILLVCITGCEAPPEKPVWEQVKIGDLTPARPGGSPVPESLKTINFSVLVFELPARNIGQLDRIWEMLFTRSLSFADYEAFAAGSFAVGFGQGGGLGPVVDTLAGAQGRQIQNSSFLLEDRQSNDMLVSRMFEPQMLFYSERGGSIEKRMFGPGGIVLRIESRRVGGLKGLCNFSAVPVFTIPTSTAIPHLAKRRREAEFVFDSSAFALTMGVGDFFLLGPRQYQDEQITLSGLFFSNPQGRLFLLESETDPSARRAEHMPAIRIFLFICTDIVY